MIILLSVATICKFMCSFSPLSFLTRDAIWISGADEARHFKFGLHIECKVLALHM